MRHAGPIRESGNTAHTSFKPCSISQEMFGKVTNVGYCFSVMESDPVCARPLWTERRRRRWRRKRRLRVKGDAYVKKDSTFLFVLACKQVLRKWHGESAAVTPNTHLLYWMQSIIRFSLHTPSLPVEIKLVCHTFNHHPDPLYHCIQPVIDMTVQQRIQFSEVHGVVMSFQLCIWPQSKQWKMIQRVFWGEKLDLDFTVAAP